MVSGEQYCPSLGAEDLQGAGDEQVTKYIVE